MWNFYGCCQRSIAATDAAQGTAAIDALQLTRRAATGDASIGRFSKPHARSSAIQTNVIQTSMIPTSASNERGSGARNLGAAESQLAAFGVDLDHICTAELTGQDGLRKRVFDLLLDRALERAGPVDWIEADIA